MVTKVSLSAVASDTYQTCIALNTPVIITNIFAVFPNLAKWDIAYVSQKIKDKQIMVAEQSPESEAGVWRPQITTTAEYFAKLANGFKDEQLQYMAQQSIDVIHPELKELIEIDRLLPENIVRQRALWIGPGGTRVPLHMDPDDNFFIQLMGKKTFHLFSPDDTPNLYANSPFSQSPELSRVKACKIDFDTYPKTKRAHPIELELEAGQCLFLPAY